MNTSNDLYSDKNYQLQLDKKLNRFKSDLSQLGDYSIEVHQSRPLHFRMRAEFRIWHENGSAHYAMNRPGEKKPYIIDSFPIGGPLITEMMTPLLKTVNENELLSKRLFSVEFLTTESGETLVTLIYHKPLNEEWEKQARKLQADLSIFIIGRSRKQKCVLSQDFVTEGLTVDGRLYHYQQVESGFTQPNAYINSKMLEWASRCCADYADQSDLLELYCGNGNLLRS